MPKMDFRDQVRTVAEYITTRDYEWVSCREIMFKLNCSATKAINLCKTLDTLSNCFEYQNGLIKYSGKPDEWKEDLKYEG